MIYFIQEEATFHIKIGFTDAVNAEGRLRALQTASPVKLHLLLSMAGDRDLESSLHLRFSNWRVAGEWFKPCPLLLRFISQQTADKHYKAACEYFQWADGLRKQLDQQKSAPPWLVIDDRYENWNKSQIGSSWMLLCPICEFDYTHPHGVWTRLGRDVWEAGVYEGTEALEKTGSRRSALVTSFWCEGGHHFCLVVQQHKGQNFVWTEPLPDLVNEDVEPDFCGPMPETLKDRLRIGKNAAREALADIHRERQARSERAESNS